MTRRNGQDELPYRSPVTMKAKAPAVTQDEQDYSTLRVVKDMLEEGMDKLNKDFNAFTLIKGDGSRVDPLDVVRDIESRQLAYDILFPTLEAVNSALEKANI